jgi:hypothetical protein
VVINFFRTHKIYVAYFLITLGAIFFRFLIPQNPRLDAVHDDSLMVQLAYNILQGEWLGEWNSTRYQALTLFKSPGYAIYLAVCIKIGIPPAVGALAIYLFSSLLLIKCGFSGNLNEIRKLLIYLIFAFNPAFYGNGSSLVYRDILSTAILTLVIAISFYLIKNPQIKRHYFVVGIGYGIVIAFASLIKDDLKYLAILTFIMVIIIYAIKHLLNSKVSEKKESFDTIKHFVIFIISVSIFYILVTESVKYLNYRNYGVSLIQDNSQGEFGELMSNLSGINTKNPTIDVFIDKEKIRLASEVSETFAKMAPYLESQNMWKEINCRANNICDQSGVFFQHELRDGFYINGMANSAIEFQENAQKVNLEILSACENKKIVCHEGIKIPGIGSNYTEINRKYTIDSIFVLAKSIFNWEYINSNNPNTLNVEDKIHPSWLEVPGIKWGYETHPVTESALGMNGFIKFLIWLYQILTYVAIVGIVLFGNTFRRVKQTKNMVYQISSCFAVFTLASILMIISNVAGWNSFQAAGSYFLIFSPFVIYFVTVIIYFIQEFLYSLVNNNNLKDSSR